MAEETPKYKTCNQGEACVNPEGPEQPIGNFSKRKASPDGHTYTCKACERERARKNYHQRKKQGRTKESKEKQEARKEYYREYYRRNKEKKREYDRQYYHSGKGKEAMRKAHAKRRKKIKPKSEKDYTRWDVIARDTDEDGILRCWICQEPIERATDVQLDHIVPVNDEAGGKDEFDNVAAAHKQCNLSRPKDGRDVEYLLNQGKGGDSQDE